MTAAVADEPITQVEPELYRWSAEEVLRLDEAGFFQDHRVELIRGEIVRMSPMNEPHALGIVFTMQALQVAFGPTFMVRPQCALDLRHTLPQPDLAVVPSIPRGTRRLPTSALLIVEVSEATLRYDRTTKAALYAEAGILDYWVLDLVHDRLIVFRDPAPDGAGGHAYGTLQTLGAADTVAPLAAPAASVAVADLLP